MYSCGMRILFVWRIFFTMCLASLLLPASAVRAAHPTLKDLLDRVVGQALQRCIVEQNRYEEEKDRYRHHDGEPYTPGLTYDESASGVPMKLHQWQSANKHTSLDSCFVGPTVPMLLAAAAGMGGGFLDLSLGAAPGGLFGLGISGTLLGVVGPLFGPVMAARMWNKKQLETLQKPALTAINKNLKLRYNIQSYYFRQNVFRSSLQLNASTSYAAPHAVDQFESDSLRSSALASAPFDSGTFESGEKKIRLTYSISKVTEFTALKKAQISGRVGVEQHDGQKFFNHYLTFNSTENKAYKYYEILRWPIDGGAIPVVQRVEADARPKLSTCALWLSKLGL